MKNKKTNDSSLGQIAERELKYNALPYPIMDILENIEIARKQKKPVYTQKMLAESACISISTYQTYLNGMSDSISLKTLQLLFVALEIDLSEFFKNFEISRKEDLYG